MKLQYEIPVAIGLWWIPVIGPALFGLIDAFIERDLRRGLVSTFISSVLASSLYIFVSVYVIKAPILGNILPVFTMILSIVGIVISMLTVYLLLSRITVTSVSNNGIYTEFYSSSIDDAKAKVENFISGLGINLSDCPSPSLELSEDKIKTTMDCNGVKIQYEVTEELKGKYKVKMWIKNNAG
ncbi:hypothetical protein [Stygiolobus caldivivus]|uniref:Uncharacterized protein n=1 Tax=Stygiolobus caldivivus TaxID=2824673 RepID=A0A8D5U7R3_9CREN|nr:hypothetical protein [Stygiolobus caldivivus]BCU70356.1 hypothetical protein KN1_16530 [Stygiolobus caldivivus]